MVVSGAKKQSSQLRMVALTTGLDPPSPSLATTRCVGAFGEDTNGDGAGAAYVFRRDGTQWREEAILVASNGGDGDRFGLSVSISSEYAIVGAELEDTEGSNAGAAYVFKRDGSQWSEEAILTASNGGSDDWFGSSVSISSDYAYVGAKFEDTIADQAGAAYVFKRDGTQWSEETIFTASNGGLRDRFGVSISVSGGYAFIGAYYEDTKGSNAGSAYVFMKQPGFGWSGPSLISPLNGSVNVRSQS